ncbi:MAG: hypothetical protein MUC31_00825 [Bacteroidales bacterium]|jgi:hypothetical protein|nr:hypothetical protein [Bacteroidales bacterium]
MKSVKLYIRVGVAVVITGLLISACNKEDGDRQPLPPVNITIDPNSTIYQELNVTGGWLYLSEIDGAEPPSRGIIVYRLSVDQFMAYERTPPFKPDSCCNETKTVCTRLLVDNYYPFVMDTCTMSKFLILDGSPVSGPASMTLSTYVTEYYGGLLYIHD